jgi:hypothetical protein
MVSFLLAFPRISYIHSSSWLLKNIKLKIELNMMTWKCTEKWRYSFIILNLCRWRTLHTPSALRRGKQPAVPIAHEARWALGLAYKSQTGEKSYAPTENLNPTTPSFSPLSVPYTDWAIRDQSTTFWYIMPYCYVNFTLFSVESSLLLSFLFPACLLLVVWMLFDHENGVSTFLRNVYQHTGPHIPQYSTLHNHVHESVTFFFNINHFKPSGPTHMCDLL